MGPHESSTHNFEGRPSTSNTAQHQSIRVLILRTLADTQYLSVLSAPGTILGTFQLYVLQAPAGTRYS